MGDGHFDKAAVSRVMICHCLGSVEWHHVMHYRAKKVTMITPKIERWSQRLLKEVNSSIYTAGTDGWND